MERKRCPKCGQVYGHCPECKKTYKLGTVSHCIKPACKAVNAPIDCMCGLVVSDDLSGVLDLDMNLIEWD